MRALLTLLLGTAALCHASSIFTVTFAPDTLSGGPGAFLQFFGTLTNNTASEVFINSDSFTFAIAGAADDTPFLLNAPISLTGNTTSSLFEIIDVTIPLAQAPGAYAGTFTVIGGVDGNAQDNLGTGAFTADVVPEPGGTATCITGLLGLAMMAGLTRRKRRV